MFPAPSSPFPGVPVDSFDAVVRGLNRALQAGIDEAELVQALRSLNASGDKELPEKFVTKGKARRMGWSPGRDLWGVPGLRGESIGGDRFGNRERRLPGLREGWREAMGRGFDRVLRVLRNVDRKRKDFLSRVG